MGKATLSERRSGAGGVWNCISFFPCHRHFKYWCTTQLRGQQRLHFTVADKAKKCCCFGSDFLIIFNRLLLLFSQWLSRSMLNGWRHAKQSKYFFFCLVYVQNKRRYAVKCKTLLSPKVWASLNSRWPYDLEWDRTSLTKCMATTGTKHSPLSVKNHLTDNLCNQYYSYPQPEVNILLSMQESQKKAS